MTDKSKKGAEPDFHYFVSSILHWNTGTDLPKLLRTQKRMDNPPKSKTSFRANQANVYYVPKPPTATYTIENYRPEVPGTAWLFTVYHDGQPTELATWLTEELAKEVGA